MKLTDFQTKFVWGIGILIILLIWMIFPLIFKQLLSVYKLPADFNQFGPFGDIYGSLNTLFTSATLLIVLYSAYLQRQANEDTRKDMADQLNQAKESMIKQLALAQASHDAQMLESKHAIFASTFNILLNQRNAILENIFTGKEEYKSKEIFEFLGAEFEELIETEWKDLDSNNDEDETIMKERLHSIMDDRIERSCSYNELISYFYMLIPLLNLIKKSNLSDADKSLYISVLSYSMHHYEQLTLLWFLTSSQDIVVVIEDMGLIDTGFSEESMAFLIKNYKKTLFAHPEVLQKWDHFFDEKKAPA